MSAVAVVALSPTTAAAAIDVSEGGVAENAVTTADLTNPDICRYYQRGICRFGALCRFSHDLTSAGGEVMSITDDVAAASPSSAAVSATASTSSASSNAVQQLHPMPSTSRSSSDWANAPVFVPRAAHPSVEVYGSVQDATADAAVATTKSWADVVGAGVTTRVGLITIHDPQNGGATSTALTDGMVCPFESPCPYGPYCGYGIHLELCEMCDQFCLHPSDQMQRRKHNRECLQQHEQAMELSFAIARSKDKTCGICFDTIMEKSGREKRFGILPNCAHIFCLECIRKWRQAKQFEHKITRSCPECRVSSDFVCPSAFWVDSKEEKDKLLTDYRTALGIKDCKYFKKGDGKCPFGNKCFYKHALPNGELVDVGLPKRGRKMHRNTDEIIDLLDIYLWEFVDQRDYHWLDLLSSASDDSDDSDWSEE